MSLVEGFRYNLRGLQMGLRTPKLLALGMLRFAVVIALTAAAVAVVIAYHQEVLGAFWNRPHSAWWAWLWVLASWLVAVVLVGISGVLAYLAAQVLFAVLIMDLMSRITEKEISGREVRGPDLSVFQQAFFLMAQEVPRALLPVLLTLAIMAAGWLTPLGPVTTVLSAAAAVVFLAWDNTDLIPARRMVPFAKRFQLLRRSLSFHLGFGIWFLIPVANILFLSFAPVGATLYYVEKMDAEGHDAMPDASREKSG
ncbi:MAG: EI24 domain-containing protein [Desulfobacteraceae bacterium]|nr:EI24 domain-containing protein [Desulfobacteraceae bacterium]